VPGGISGQENTMEYPWFIMVVDNFGETKISISQKLAERGILLGLAMTPEGARKLLWEKLIEQDENN
jgi:hypothetical protein